MTALRILVVDDDAGMRGAIERALRDYSVVVPDVDDEVSFDVEVAESGEVAMKKIEEREPDIMVLDHKLPGIQGLDLLERVGKMGVHTLTIVITGYATVANIVAATKRGAYDFLAKPFAPVDLRAVVRKAATRQILEQQTKKLARERRVVRFQLIQMLGHELKAPLNAIDGYLELLQDPERIGDQKFVQHCVDRSLFRLEGMRKLVEDLLDMTRIESGLKRRRLEKVDLRALAAEVIENWRPSALEQHIQVALHVQGPCSLNADRGEIEMLLNNFVSNAIKYNKPGGVVDVTLQRRASDVLLIVADTGIGMTQEEAQRLFREFVRIKNSKTKNISGSGLGLSIVKKLVSLYNGTVTVDSEPNEGTTFTVVLKDVEQPAENAEE